MTNEANEILPVVFERMFPIRGLADQLTSLVIASNLPEREKILAWSFAKKQIGLFLALQKESGSPSTPQPGPQGPSLA